MCPTEYSRKPVAYFRQKKQLTARCWMETIRTELVSIDWRRTVWYLSEFLRSTSRLRSRLRRRWSLVWPENVHNPGRFRLLIQSQELLYRTLHSYFSVIVGSLVANRMSLGQCRIGDICHGILCTHYIDYCFKRQAYSEIFDIRKFPLNRFLLKNHLHSTILPNDLGRFPPDNMRDLSTQTHRMND